MKITKKDLILLVGVLFILSVTLVSAIDFNPNGDIEMRNIWKIKNATNINAENITVSNIVNVSKAIYSYNDKLVESCDIVVDPSGKGDYTDLKTALGSQLSGTICINAGIYNFTSRINTYSPNNLTVYASPNAIINLSGGADQGMVRLRNVTNFRWVGGQFIGNASFVFNLYNDIHHISIENIYCHDISWIVDAACIGIPTYTDSNTVYEDIVIKDSYFENVYSGVDMVLGITKQNKTAKNIHFINNRINNAHAAFRIASEHSSHLIENIYLDGNFITNITNPLADSANALVTTELTGSNSTLRNIFVTNNYIENVFNSTGTLSDHEAIYIKSDNVVVSNNILKDAGYFSIGIRRSNHNIIISDNIITYTDNYTSDHTLLAAIHAVVGNDSIISGNIIKGAKGTNNYGSRNVCGISISGTAANNALIVNNMIDDSDFGICAASLSSAYPTSGFFYVKDNYITNIINSSYILDPDVANNFSLIYQDKGEYIMNGTNLTVNDNIVAKILKGNLSWNYLYDYPVACPSGSYLTQLGDSIICTATADVNITTQNLIPAANNTFDIGNSTRYWKDIYVGIINLITSLIDSQISDDITANASKLIEISSLNDKIILNCNNITGSSGALCNNQTNDAKTYTDQIVLDNNASWSDTHNATYDATTADVNANRSNWFNNETFNQSLTDSLYAEKEWGYNQTTPAIDYSNTNFYNRSSDINTGSSYNISSDNFIGKIFYFQNSTGSTLWKMYVNDSGSLITESV